jgi:uncharacterized protein with HEPN domain
LSDDRLEALIERIRAECEAALRFVGGVERADFLENELVQHGVAMCLIAIGEYVSKIVKMSPDFIQSHPEIPWMDIVGMRNRIAHGYYGLDFEVVWSTVSESMPKLLAALPNDSSNR